jgi:hypothetical protein
MLSRRDLVGKLAAAAAAVGAAGIAQAAFGAVRRPGARRADTARADAHTNTDTGSPDPTTAAERQPARPTLVDAEPPATLSAPSPWELVRPLREGSEVGHGWRVAGLSGVVNGACVLTLRNGRGREYRVHLCANDGRPQGLVYTQGVDLVVMNGGAGDLPTEEGLAQAVAELAHVVAANEAGRAEVMGALLPQAERVQRFASAASLR